MSLREAAQQALAWIHYHRRACAIDEPIEERNLRAVLARQEPLAGMSAITISRATALQALAAMDKTLRFTYDEDYVKLNHAIDTFKAALAQQTPHPDTIRLAYLYSKQKTSSNALIKLEMKFFDGKTISLEEIRVAIDDAMANPLKGETNE